MQTNLLPLMLTLSLFMLVTSLFVFMKHYIVNRGLGTPRNLHHHEIAISVFIGLVVFFVVGNRHIPLISKTIFLLCSVGMHYFMANLELKPTIRTKRLAFPRSFMIFHNGKFLKGAIMQHKLTEEDIQRLLHGKGVVDLSEVDTLILEQNGELVVIYKNKTTTTA